MNLLELKDEINTLKEKKLKLQGNLQQIKKTLKEQGYDSVEDAKDSLLEMKKQRISLKEEFDKKMEEINSFLEDVCP